MSTIVRFVSATGVLGAAIASAQALDPELTMRPIENPALELPAPVSEMLGLPDAALGIALERGAESRAPRGGNRGRGVENRERALVLAGERRDVGRTAAASARERAAELGAAMVESARVLREGLVRGGWPLDLPGQVELPQLPGNGPSRAEAWAPTLELPDRAVLP